MSDNTTTTAIVAISGALTAMFRIAVIGATITVVAYFTYKSIECLAGRNTDANIALKFLANINFASKVSYAFGAGGIAYGYYQRRLRKSRIKSLSEYATKLEKHINPSRTSSNIQPDGTTKGDEII